MDQDSRDDMIEETHRIKYELAHDKGFDIKRIMEDAWNSQASENRSRS